MAYRRFLMWIALAFVLAVAWIVCFIGFHVTSAAIHLLIILALVSVVVHFATGTTRRTV